MNEELQKRLSESADGLLEWANQGGAFVKEQAPLYVQELLAWEFTSSVWRAVLGVLFLVVMCIAFVVTKKWASNVIKDRDSEVPHLLGAIFVSLFVGLLFIMSVVYQFEVTTPAISRAIKVKVAPRVVVVEALRGMVK